LPNKLVRIGVLAFYYPVEDGFLNKLGVEEGLGNMLLDPEL